MALLVLVSFYWCSHTYFSGSLIEPSLNKVYQAFVLLVPLNMLLFALMRERGIFSVAARLRFIFLAVQVGGMMLLFRQNFEALLPYIAKNYSWLAFLNDLQVPQTAMLAGVPSFIIIAMLALRRQTPVESGLLGGLVAFFIASNWLATPDIHISYCASGALIISLSVLRDSYNMAFCDDLTGIPSRRSLNENLHGLGRKYTVAMLDVDHFKLFNDKYGHDVGDQVLKSVARKMMDVGGGGKSYRYGGEEFTIVFSGRRAEDVIPHLEKLRMDIADYRLALRSGDRPKNSRQGKVQRGNSRGKSGGDHVSVTVSIGVAESGEELNTTTEVMKAADKALYKAKNKGRNQVCC